MRKIKFREWFEEPDYSNIPSRMVEPRFQGEINKVFDLNGKTLQYQGTSYYMQYIGINDFKGNEIYAGDILHFGSMWCVGDEYDPREEEHTGFVEYRPDYASYVVNCNGKIYPLEELTSFDGYSVQYNVHENPELLEESYGN